jgi:DNA-binding IclR family transcriptional regulator
LAAGKLKAHTKHTIVTVEGLRQQIAETRKRGFAISPRSFDVEVVGIAAPIFDWSGQAYGCIAVASVAARLNTVKKRQICAEVLKGAIEITRAMGAEPHASLLHVGKRLAA